MMRRFTLFIFMCFYTSCFGQNGGNNGTVSAEIGIAVNGQPWPVAREESGRKYYKYYFKDRERLSFSVINNNASYELTDCFEDSNDPCWLPEGRMFLKERPEQTYCCIARHNDSGQTTRLTVAVTLHDGKMPQIRMKRIDGKTTCDADKLVAGRPYQVAITPQRAGEPVFDARCRDIKRNKSLKTPIERTEVMRFTTDPSGALISIANATFNESGRRSVRCFYFTDLCWREEFNDTLVAWLAPPPCWTDSGEVNSDVGVACDVELDVVAREDVARPAGSLSAGGAQFSGRAPHALHFSEGQPAAFYCNRTADGFAQLTYTDKVYSADSTGYQQDRATMIMNLIAAVNNDTYVECDFTDIMYEEHLRIRVRLLAKTEVNIDP